MSEGVRKLEIGDRSTFLEVRRNPTLSVLLALDRNVLRAPVTLTQTPRQKVGIELAKTQGSPPLPPPPPPQPDPAAIEARDWERLRNSNSLDELQGFLNRQPNAQHAEEARNRIGQLRQAQAKEAEDKAFRDQESAWRALDKKQRATLRDFITRYGNSPHAPEAQTLLNGIEKNEVDDSAAQRTADQRVRDQEAIKQTLARYEKAFDEMNIPDLQSVWLGTPGEIKKVKDQFKNFKTFQVRLTLTAPIIINGDSATAECARTVTVVPNNSPAAKPKPISNQDRVRITLTRSGPTWRIFTIAPL